MTDSEIRKLKQYSEALDGLAKNNSTDIFPNRDSEHAAIAIAKILKYSNEKVIVFDDDLKGDIVNNSTVESFRSSVIDFLSRKGKLQVVISDKSPYDDEELRLFLEVLIDVFPQQVSVKLASSSFKTSMKEIYGEKINFVIGDTNKFRLEKYGNNNPNNKTREAKGSFNNKEITNKLLSIFNTNYSSCKDYF